MPITHGNTQKTRLQRWFPERQIYIRARGEVQFLALPSKLQMGAAAVLLLVVVWVMFSSAKIFLRDVIIEAKNETIETLGTANADQQRDIEHLQGAIMDKTRDLEQRSDYLQDLIKSDPTGKISKSLGSTSVLSPEEDTSEGDEADKSAYLERAKTSAGVMAFFIGSANAAPAPLARKAFEAQILPRLNAIAERQDAVAATLINFAENKILEADDILAPFRLRALDLANVSSFSLNNVGQGGPNFTDLASGAGLFSNTLNLSTPYPALGERWSQLSQIYDGLQSVPLLTPVKESYLSSRFGRRIDPFTKKAGWHPGVDLAGWPGTLILTTSAGVVTKAGIWSTYGNMVEVDHGNGFKTRYAHMRAVLVARGQLVSPGDVLGEMGCSGRCVSTHLHYEIFFNDNPRNPLPFMEAPEDVQQIKREALTANGTGH